MNRANNPRNQFATLRRERFSRSDSAFWKTFSRGVARANLGRELTSVGSSNAFIRKKNAVYASTQFSRGRGEAILILRSGTGTEQNAYYDGIISASSQIVSLRNTADSNDATFASQYESALASAQASNAAAYESATSAAEDAYKEALDDAWLDAYLERLSLGATLKDAYDQATETAKSALDDASDDLRAALFAGYDAFDAEMSEYLRAFNHYQTRIDLGQSVPNDAILNPTYDFEVCFVAGTPVLMADGSTKPIEALEVGDLVLAADHLNPEGTPEPARVARTFDNGLKDVVKLTFADGTSLVCTPSHRFYVLDRGWVCASEMNVGEFCLNANGERVKFVGREEIAERRGVYNIEVEGKHTYFAGDGVGVLAHNECSWCAGKDKYSNYLLGLGIYTVETTFSKPRSLCPHCESSFKLPYSNGNYRSRNIQRLLNRTSDSVSFKTIESMKGTLREYLIAYYQMDSEEIQYLDKQMNSRKPFVEEHYQERFLKNNMWEFLTLDLDLLSDSSLKRRADEGHIISCYFLGDRWELLTSEMSIFHAPCKDGTKCFKWCSDRGRELVIRDDHTLETNPLYIGTFNYGYPFGYHMGSLSHLVWDILPYKAYDNIPKAEKPLP